MCLYRLSIERFIHQKFSTMRMALWVLCLITACTAIIFRYRSIDPRYDLGVVIFGAAAITGILSELRINLIYRCSVAYTSLYLNGYSLYHVFDEEFFSRLSHYVGHGFCYEIAGLNMLALRDNRTAHFIVARAHDRESGKNYWHAWVEFKAYGLWWTIDPAWDAKFISLRRLHRIRIPAEYRRIIPWSEFWSLQIVHDFDEALRTRETSHLLHELYGFRKPNGTDDDTRLFAEHIGIDEPIRNDGRRNSLTLMDIYGVECPISTRIIHEYMLKPTRLMPKRHTYHNALRLNKIVNRKLQAIQK